MALLNILKYFLYLILFILLFVLLLGLYFGMRNKYDRMYYENKFKNESYITYKNRLNKDYKLSNWQSLIKPETPFNKIVTPGTHDSLTFDWGNSYSLIQQYTSYWAQTQYLNIMQQLLSGVRYFDTRVGICKKRFCDKDKIVAFHGDFSSNITYESIVSDLVNFMNNNPSEIIVWRFNILNNNDEVNQIIKDKKLHSKLNLIPYTSKYFNISLGELREMRPDKTKAGIIFVQNDPPSDNFNIWSTSKIKDPYDETSVITNKNEFTSSKPSKTMNPLFKSSMNKIYSNKDLGNDTLTVMQMIGVYVTTTKSSLLYSLERISKDVNKALFTNGLPPPPKNGYNVIMIDFMTPKESNAIINLNPENIFIN
jgi:hypothetical protein